MMMIKHRLLMSISTVKCFMSKKKNSPWLKSVLSRSYVAGSKYVALFLRHNDIALLCFILRCLQLHPQNTYSKKHLSLYLRLVSSNKEEIRAKFKFWMLDVKQAKVTNIVMGKLMCTLCIV